MKLQVTVAEGITPFSVTDNKVETSDYPRMELMRVVSKLHDTELQHSVGATWETRAAENTHNSRNVTLAPRNQF